jgi:hypothetical protein
MHMVTPSKIREVSDEEVEQLEALCHKLDDAMRGFDLSLIMTAFGVKIAEILVQDAGNGLSVIEPAMAALTEIVTDEASDLLLDHASGIPLLTTTQH